MPYNNLEALREEFYKYMGWTKSSGIHGKELYKAIADFWLSKFSELEQNIKNIPEKYSAIDGYKTVRIEDVLSLFPQEREK